MQPDLNIIQSLVGPITEEQMQHVDCYIFKDVSIFIPVVGPCYYSISPKHSHPGYSFILNHDDNCSVQIGKRILQAKTNTLNAMSPGVAHHEIQSDEFARYIAVFVAKDIFEQEYLRYAYTIPRFEGTAVKPHVNLLTQIKGFMLEHENRLPGFESLLSAISKQIIHSIIRSLTPIVETQAKVSNRVDIDRAVAYIHEHFKQEFSIEDIADFISLSKSHFTRIFKDETGKAPIEYVIDVRLRHAKKLLMQDGASITDVAFASGFNSSSHFATSFQKKYNLSPSAYKKTIA